MSIDTPIDLIIILAPNFIVFMYQMTMLSGDLKGGGNFFPPTSERFDSGIILHPIAIFIGVLLWALCLKIGWL